jgi:hypothetical protein
VVFALVGTHALAVIQLPSLDCFMINVVFVVAMASLVLGNANPLLTSVECVEATTNAWDVIVLLGQGQRMTSVVCAMGLMNAVVVTVLLILER